MRPRDLDLVVYRQNWFPICGLEACQGSWLKFLAQVVDSKPAHAVPSCWLKCRGLHHVGHHFMMAFWLRAPMRSATSQGDL